MIINRLQRAVLLIGVVLLILVVALIQGAKAIPGDRELLAEGYSGPALIWPFATGHDWRVSHGYNTTSHGGDGNGGLGNKGDKFTFDLVRVDGVTLDRSVYAAQNGVLGPQYWMLQVYDDKWKPTNYYVYYGHFILDSKLKERYDRGEIVKVEQDQKIGVVTTNPYSAPHLHFGITRWAGAGAPSPNFPDDSGWIPVYFKNICSKNYPFNGGVNEYEGTIIVPCDPPPPPTPSPSATPLPPVSMESFDPGSGMRLYQAVVSKDNDVLTRYAEHEVSWSSWTKKGRALSSASFVQPDGKSLPKSEN